MTDATEDDEMVAKVEAVLAATPIKPPRDVVRLVIAARLVLDSDGGREELSDLDAALEAFAARVPFEDEPTH